MWTYAGVSPLFFMIVSFPPDAAVTICFSIELLIFDDRFFCIVRRTTAPSFLGGMDRAPFLGFCACFDCRPPEPDADGRPFELP